MSFSLNSISRAAITRALGPHLLYGLERAYGGSPVTLAKRIFRLWCLGRSMLHVGTSPPKPIRLQIETTNICNLKCRMCARQVMDESELSNTSISLATFTKIIDDIKPFYVTLNGLGEPLIDETIFEKLDLLHARHVRTAVPTNGTLLMGRRLDRLLKSFPDVLTLSIDGATKESFERIRTPAKFDTFIDNACALIDARAAGRARKGRLQILCALQKDNLFDFEPMYHLVNVTLKVDSFSVVPAFDYSDSKEAHIADLIPSVDDVERLHRELDRRIATAKEAGMIQFFQDWKAASSIWLSNRDSSVPLNNDHACTTPLYSTYIDARGRVYPCCFLLNTNHVMGNIFETSFDAIWNGEQYRTFRQQLASSRPKIPGCCSCRVNHDSLITTVKKYHAFFPGLT